MTGLRLANLAAEAHRLGTAAAETRRIPGVSTDAAGAWHHQHAPMGLILVGTDGSAAANAALHQALELARRRAMQS